MPIIINFGKYKDKGISIEQIALRDYGYFSWILDNIRLYGEVGERIRFVDYAANDFVSQESCSLKGCKEKPRYISIYESSGVRVNYGGFVYCSRKHLDIDPEAQAYPG